MKLSTFLEKATARIKKRWIKGRLEDLQGGVCSIGALDAAFGNGLRQEYTKYTQAENLLADIIKQHGGRDAGRHPRQIIVSFNDKLSTTKETIIKIFTEAQRRAKLEEAKK